MDELSIGVLCLAGCVFAASVAAKLRSRPAYRSFRAGLGDTALVPGRLLPAVSAALCAAEAAIAAVLAGGQPRWRRRCRARPRWPSSR